MTDEKEQVEHTLESFAEAAIAEFGDKVKFSTIGVPEEVETALLADGWTSKMIAELKEYKQVWLIPEKKYGEHQVYTCPRCGEDLSGIFGGFEWGLVHGYGHCANCRKVNLKLYHYFKDDEKHKLFQAYALTGF